MVGGAAAAAAACRTDRHHSAEAEGCRFWLWGGFCRSGEYKNDRVHGVGAYYFTNGQVYEGRWENGKKSGPLVYTVETGQCFAAEFSDR